MPESLIRAFAHWRPQAGSWAKVREADDAVRG